MFSCKTSNGFVFTDTPQRQSNGTYNESSCQKSMTVNGNTTTFTYVFTFNPVLQRKMTPTFGDERYGTVNGTAVYLLNTRPTNNTAIYQDHVAPSDISIKQENQKTSGIWATIKKLTISGTDSGGSTGVTIVIKDENGKSVYSGSAVVSNNKFSLSCTPLIEANGSKTFTAVVTDTLGNVGEQTFVVSNTDSRAPVWSGTTNYATSWVSHRPVTFSVTDSGAGSVSMAFNDASTSAFITANVNGTTFSRDFDFIGNLYESTAVKVYYKDGLDNIGSSTVSVGYIDSTAPTFSITKKDAAKESSVTFKADDINKTLSKQGSGQTPDANGKYGYYYGYSRTNKSETATWSSLQTSNSYTQTKMDGGVWYFWVKDYAGNISASQTLTLKPTFTITYNANGGKNPPSSATVAYGDSYAIYSGYDKPTSPYDNKGFAGYALSGWSTDGTDHVKYYPGGNIANVTSDITLTAVWTQATYTATYDANGGTGAPSSDWHIFHGADYTVSNVVPVKTGYQFLGWKCTEDGVVYPGGSVYSTTGTNTKSYVHQNLHFTAVWSGKIYFVSYDGNGSSTGNMNTDIVDYDVRYSIKTCGYTRNNYKFIGWNTAQDGSGTWYSVGQSVVNLCSTDSASFTLYAQWQVDRNKYTLTLNPNNGTYKGSPDTYISEYWPDPASVSVYGYKNSAQTYNVDADGYYLIEAWGAAGGNDACVGGFGGYVKSYIWLQKGQQLTIATGGQGWTLHGADACGIGDATPAFNGGGRAGQTGNNGNYSGVGGGATSVCLTRRGNGELYNYSSYVDDVIVVAGGGGGGSASNRGVGGTAFYVKNTSGQTNLVAGNANYLWQWSFGEGQNAGNHDGGGGGGGFYGGVCGWDDGAGRTSGGGASFVNNYIGAVSDSTSFTPDNNRGAGQVRISRFESSGLELLETPLRKHYNFVGWYNYGTGTIKLTTNGYSTTVYGGGRLAPYTVGVSEKYSYVCDFSTAITQIEARWEPYKYNIVYNSNTPSGATMTGSVAAQNSLAYDSTYNLRQNSRCCAGTDLYNQIGGFSCYRYHFVEWNTKPDGSGHSFKSGESIKNLTDYVNPDAPDNYTVTLYAIWESSARTVTYDKNSPYALQYGNVKEIVYHCPDGSVDTCHSHHYTTRIGWDFIGWGANSEAKTTYANSESGLKIGDNDITLYAIHSRNLRVVLANDVVSKTSDLSYDRMIYNHDTQFKYDDNAFINGTTRVNGTYKVQFAHNGASTIIDKGGVTYSDGVLQATGLQSDNTIVAYPTFKGWCSQPFKAGDYLGTYPGSLIGGSTTKLTVDIDNLDGTKYVLDGNANGTVTLYSNNRTLYMYAQWNRAYIVLPDATRHEERAGVNGTDQDLFLGWFTKPQLGADTTDGGTYVGKAGDMVYVDRDIVLYPWFNIAPSVVQSEIVNNFDNPSNDSENLFWEGQSISYTQLLTLINATDEDNHYPSPSKDGEIEWNGLNSWKDIYALNVMSYMNTYMKENHPEYSAQERLVFISDAVSNLAKYSNNYNSDGTDDSVDFEPYMTGITYYCDGVDAYGNTIANAQSWTQSISDIKANGLNTKVENIGKVVLHYEITDNGTFDYYNDKYVWTVNGYRVNSPITVKFDLTTSIKFNNPPKYDLYSTAIYTKDPYYTSENISQYLIDKQIVSDYEDDYNNAPWWVAHSSDSTLAYTTDTRKSLVDSRHIVKIKDITFQTGYETDCPEMAARVSAITDIKELFRLKESSNTDENEAFDHITTFKVVMDCTDQWTKAASAGLCGQTEPERSFQVIFFNNEDDYDIAMAALDEKVRYIDSSWTDTLGTSSYWSDQSYGKLSLDSTFARYLSKSGIVPDVYAGNIVNKTVDNESRKVNITVNDYSE